LTENWFGYGDDFNTVSAQGTEDTTGDNYTFAETDSSAYVYVLNKSIAGEFNASVNIHDYSMDFITGTTSTGPSGSSYSYVTSNISSFVETVSGAQTMTITEESRHPGRKLGRKDGN
jgi:hypothetical protein